MLRGIRERFQRDRETIGEDNGTVQYPVDDKFYADLKGIVDEKASRQNPLKASVFITPAIFGKGVDDTKLGTFAFSISSGHVHFFEIWSDGDHTEFVAVAGEGAMRTLKEQICSVFSASIAPELAGYKIEGDHIPLLPPWLRPGMHCTVLNVRETFPFREMSPFESGNDPFARLITAIQSLGTDQGQVYTWLSFGWTEFDWGPYAQQYASLTGSSEIMGETYAEPMVPSGSEGEAKPAHRDLLTRAQKRAQAPRLVASLRVALFSEDPEVLAVAVETMRGTLKVFGSATNPVQVDKGEVDELLEMAGRIIVPASQGRHAVECVHSMLNTHMKEVMRGREGMAGAQSLPVLLLTSPELPLFVHLPLWSTPDRLTSLRWVKAPTPFVEKPPKIVDTLNPILVGRSLELSEPEDVYVGLEELNTHVLFLGQSGSGKTTQVENLLLQLAKAMEDKKLNATIWVVDPVGRLGELWITRAPPDAQKRTIFFEPEKTPWGMNPFALPPAANKRDYQMMAKERASTVTRIIREVSKMDTGQSQWGHRLRRIIRLIIMSLYDRGVDRPDRQLFTFMDVVRIAYAVGNEEELTKIVTEMGISSDLVVALGGYNKEARDAVLHKIERFVEPVIRDFICAEESIDFYALDQPGNIIFFSFKGFMHMPDDVATLMGSVVMSVYSSELARKHKLSWEKSSQTYLIIDEFHRTADLLSFRDILATARNIRLSLWLVYQGARQVEDEALHEEVFNNAHTKFIFTVGGGLAANLKSDLDLALGRQMAQRLQGLESYRCYLLRSGSGGVATPTPHLIRTLDFPEPVWSLEQALEYYTLKMRKFKQVQIPEKSALGIAGQSFGITGQVLEETKHEMHPALAPFNELHIKFPRAEDYPVLWAIRDYFMVDEATWPTLDELIDFLHEQHWVSGKYKNREFVIQALLRLKAGYVSQDRTQRYCIMSHGDREMDLKRSLVLLETPPAGGPLGGEEHLRTTQKFLEYYVREFMPTFMAFMPDHADNVPDGVLVMRSTDESWALTKLVAVETHMSDSEHPLRSIEQTKKRFEQGYAKVIIICTESDDERKVRGGIAKDEDLAKRLKEGTLEVFTYKMPPKTVSSSTPTPAAGSTEVHREEKPQAVISMAEMKKESDVLAAKVMKLFKKEGATHIMQKSTAIPGVTRIELVDEKGKRLIVQCEARFLNNKIRLPEVMEFIREVDRERRNHGAVGGFYITNGDFEPNCFPYEKEAKLVNLIDGVSLAALLAKKPADSAGSAKS